jgi:hypothetical protein
MDARDLNQPAPSQTGVRRLVRVNGNNSSASVIDMGEPAAPFALPDSPSSSRSLSDWIAVLAGVDPENPTQFAPPPQDDGLRDFYRDVPAWFPQARI